MIKSKLFIAISILLLFSECEDLFIESPDTNQNMEDFEAAWERVNTVYPYLELKKINWDSIYI